MCFRMMFLVLLCALLLPLPLYAIPTNGLVAHWAGENNANDSSGNNHHGSLLGGMNFTAGKVGQGFLFDNIDDGVEIPNTDNAFNLTNAWTITAWVNPFSNGGDARSDPIVWKIANNGNNADTFTFGWHSDNTFAWGLERDSDGVDFRPSSASHAPNQFHHVAALYDGNALKIYVNGILEKTEVIGSVLAHTGPGPLRIGNIQHSNHGGAGVFHGIIDEVYIYDRGLSETEVLQIRDNVNTAAIPEPTSGLLLLFACCGAGLVLVRQSSS